MERPFLFFFFFLHQTTYCLLIVRQPFYGTKFRTFYFVFYCKNATIGLHCFCFVFLFFSAITIENVQIWSKLYILYKWFLKKYCTIATYFYKVFLLQNALFWPNLSLCVSGKNIHVHSIMSFYKLNESTCVYQICSQKAILFFWLYFHPVSNHYWLANAHIWWNDRCNVKLMKPVEIVVLFIHILGLNEVKFWLMLQI